MAKQNHEWETYYLLDKILEEKDYFEADEKVLLYNENYEDLRSFKERHKNYLRGLEENLIKSYLKTKESRNTLKDYKTLIEKQSIYVYESIYDEKNQDGAIRLKKKIDEKHYSFLEEIIHQENNTQPYEQTQKEKLLLKGYYSTGNAKYLDDFLESTENKAVKEVDYLGPGVLGMYIPSTDTIYVVRSLTGPIRDFVIAHEKAHRRRAYAGESQNEEAVDAEARAASGIPVYR